MRHSPSDMCPCLVTWTMTPAWHTPPPPLRTRPRRWRARWSRARQVWAAGPGLEGAAAGRGGLVLHAPVRLPGPCVLAVPARRLLAPLLKPQVRHVGLSNETPYGLMRWCQLGECARAAGDGRRQQLAARTHSQSTHLLHPVCRSHHPQAPWGARRPSRPCRTPTACCAARLTRGWPSAATPRAWACWPIRRWPWGEAAWVGARAGLHLHLRLRRLPRAVGVPERCCCCNPRARPLPPPPPAAAC